jgi:hypothetical protein
MPVVQAIGIGPAAAAVPSPDCVTYCTKWNVDANTVDDVTGVWTNNWTNLGSANARGNCLVCPPDALNNVPTSLIDDFEVRGDPEAGFTVTFPSTCSLSPPGDPTPDEFYGMGSAAAKCGGGISLDACAFLTPDDVESVVGDPTRSELFFPVCPSGRSISHLEVLIRCCE